MKSISRWRLWRNKKKQSHFRSSRRAHRRWGLEPLEGRRLMAVDLPATFTVDTNHNGIFDVSEIEALSQSLDNGTYIFAKLDFGQYYVRVAPNPPGRLAANETLMTLNFRGSVSGVKWDDLNGNAARDAGEPGVAGVRIFADLNSDGRFTNDEPSTLTGVDGSYRLVLTPGVYAIREVLPAGTVQTFPLGAETAGVAQALQFAGQTLSAKVEGAAAVYHNAANPADVNADGMVSVLDALNVVQGLRGGIRSLAEGEEGGAGSHFVDVNGDAVLSIADLLGVIEVLRGEGEASAQNDRPGVQTPDPFTISSNTTQRVLPVLDNDTGGGALTITGLGTLETGIMGLTAQGDHGGVITVQSGGAQGNDVVLYTPQPDFFGIERFIYQVRDASDNTLDQAEVTVEVVPDRDYASFTYQVFMSDGVTPASSVEIGQEFIVRAFVKDDRTNFTPTANRGVFSPYLDFTYSEALLDLVTVPSMTNPHGFSRDVRFGPQYQELVSIDAFGNGVIDEIGAAQTNGFEINTQPLGPNPVAFFDARFRATAVGTAVFAGNRADDPAHQFVFFRPSNLEPLDPDFIDFGQLSLTITPPVGAVPDNFVRNEDLQGPAGSELINPVLDLLANDAPFVAGQPLSIAGLGPNNANAIVTASGGQVEIINGGQAVRYTPAPNFNGSDSFSYRVTDGQRTETALVNVTVVPQNDAPVAGDDTVAADNESVLTIAAPGVLANDTDIDGDTLAVTGFQAVSSLGAAVSVNPSGRFTYNPTVSAQLQNLMPGEVLIDTFTYTVSDGNGGVDTGMVRVLVSLNTGGAHVIEILPGVDVANINFGNMRLQPEGELEDAIHAIAADLTAT